MIERGRHLVRFRAHDQAMELLEAPAAIHELDRHPVEQLLIRGLLSHLPEVVERRDDAAPHVVVPDAVDDDTRRQRVVARAEPFGEREPPARRLAVRTWNFGWRIPVGQDRRERRLHQRTLAVWIAADEEIRRRRLVSTRTSNSRAW